MPVSFPPVPVYPQALDSDYTLFLVYNTTETVITADSAPWGGEIPIRPVSSSDPDIWADNGFATISGELLYYDAVEKNGYGHVIALKDCVRNLGGEETLYNVEGTDIRSFVIAEHHNQLMQATIAVEEYLGGVCRDEDSLACCLLETDVDDCPDDGNCPDVNFSYRVVEEDLCTGILIEYTIDIDGEFDEFLLEFGDGTNSTVADSGTKQYPQGQLVDPVITIGNQFCEIVQTNTIRTVPTEPEVALPPTGIIIPIPEIEIPNLDLVTPIIPEPNISIPPIVLPPVEVNIPDLVVSIPGLSTGVPSVISLVPTIPSVISIIPPVPSVISIEHNLPSVISVDVDIPSVITISTTLAIPSLISFGPVNIPSIISFGPVDIPSVISFGPVDIPSVINVIDTIPNVIVVTPTIPSTISITPAVPSIITISPEIPGTININPAIPATITVIGMPDVISVVGPSDCLCIDWGTPPALSVNVTCTCTCEPSATPFAPTMRQLVEEGYYDFDDDVSLAAPAMNFDADSLGIPSQITIAVPKISPILIEHTLPTKIVLDAPLIPSIIDIRGGDLLPSNIEVVVPSKMPTITIDASGLPSAITMDWGDVPSIIELQGPEIPSIINIQHDIPSVITVEGMVNTISVEGFPDHIPLRVENPDDLVLRLEPAEVKITMDIEKLLTDGEEGQYCFALTPCKPA